MKTKIYNALNKRYIVILIMLLAPLFGFIDRNFVFFFGLSIVLFIFWKSGYDKSKFGLDFKLNWNTFFKSIVYTIILCLIEYVLIGPLLDAILGMTDLSSFDDVKGDLGSYIGLMLVMWVFAAFGEELLNRGFYLKWLAEFMGNSKNSWIISSIITSAYFAAGHIYQGVRGAVGVFIWSILISLIFIKNRKNLWLLILIHGLFDTVGITLIYFDKIDYISLFFKTLYGL
ncbi:CPBP family intramembrane glutamic endopeptidase [Aurantibacter sp.]|uniref:CPBP family intramembrane glutamic endopeptidase n=1 Tax=Aurantibacter sp. TaxID=2807103 RepID=UPI0032665333